jgi:hypothetical protein
MSQDKRTSFVVRVARDRRGQVSGVIERVATGAKEAFTGMDAIGQVIVRMLQGARPLAPDDAGAPPESSEEAPPRSAFQGGPVPREASERASDQRPCDAGTGGRS